ncbi:MAG: Methyltransferase type 11 [Acidobacteria bacterium]|nr:Methyltransferase type 11 [Acidobacteriota bacterium]
MTNRCRDLDGVNRFADRAAIYARSRPSYPRAAIDYLFARAPRRPARVVDLGAGTGISTRLLSETNGGAAFGIDPGLDMLLAAGPDARGTLAAGRAERLPIRDASVDLLTSFNAFHWFQPEPFFDEARRVLAPDGRLALAWNDWSHDDPFTAAFVRLMRSRAGDYPPEDREAEVAPLYATPRFTRIESAAFDNVHELDLVSLKLRLQSMTYIPREGPEWDALSEELTLLFERFADGGGFVRHRYKTNVYVAS